jgi:hypothetical protein
MFLGKKKDCGGVRMKMPIIRLPRVGITGISKGILFKGGSKNCFFE